MIIETLTREEFYNTFGADFAENKRVILRDFRDYSLLGCFKKSEIDITFSLPGQLTFEMLKYMETKSYIKEMVQKKISVDDLELCAIYITNHKSKEMKTINLEYNDVEDVKNYISNLVSENRFTPDNLTITFVYNFKKWCDNTKKLLNIESL